MRFLVEQVEFDFDYDCRGWVLPNGEIISTNNAPHYTKENNELNKPNILKYNFGYERYIGLPKEKLTSQQYETLTLLLDNYFIGKNNVGERSSKIEINCDMDKKGDFISKRYSPFEYTTDDIIKIIKRYYSSGNLFEDINTNNLYHAYHGARSDFNRFEQQFIGAHALEHGYGFYFTSEIEQAKSYGDFIIEADLIIRNPFSTDTITITKEQVKEYMRKYVDPIGDDYLSNYGWYEDEGYEVVLDNCVNSLFSYNNNDNDIISEILLWVQNKYSDEAYDAIFEIFGKDGIIYKTSSDWGDETLTNYIVYSNSQIINKNKIKVNRD